MAERWVRPESPPGVEFVQDDSGMVYQHRTRDDRWQSQEGVVWLTWSQLLSQVKWLREVPSTNDRRIAFCRASERMWLDIGSHTCGLDRKMYFQGNQHHHGGQPCVDWAHCTRLSDEGSAL